MNFQDSNHKCLIRVEQSACVLIGLRLDEHLFVQSQIALVGLVINLVNQGARQRYGEIRHVHLPFLPADISQVQKVDSEAGDPEHKASNGEAIGLIIERCLGFLDLDDRHTNVVD